MLLVSWIASEWGVTSEENQGPFLPCASLAQGPGRGGWGGSRVKVAGLERSGSWEKWTFVAADPPGGGTWLGRRFFGYYRGLGRRVVPSQLVGILACRVS